MMPFEKKSLEGMSVLVPCMVACSPLDSFGLDYFVSFNDSLKNFYAVVIRKEYVHVRKVPESSHPRVPGHVRVTVLEDTKSRVLVSFLDERLQLPYNNFYVSRKLLCTHL